MDIIERFIESYRREFDFFDQVARLAHGRLESALASSGVQGIVTFRAKRPDRLEQKLKQRSSSKSYASTEDIYKDIVDFAGVRVALYFPAARDEVEKVIRTNFEVIEDPKQFPQSSTITPSYKKRFSGYWATHYRVRLKENYLQGPQKRYAEASIEIQVASVLMHAWSEVEHDLVYKPLQGELSEDEYAILDELNDLVLAGEVALERLQRAIAARVAREGAQFTSHYELAAFLQRCAAPMLSGDINDSAMGRVDVLFDLLVRLQLNTPEHVRPLVTAIHPDVEKRAIADQLIDQIVESDEVRYRFLAEIRRKYEHEPEMHENSLDSLKDQRAMFGTFMHNWIELEKVMDEMARAKGMEGPHFITSRAVLERFSGLDPEMRRELDRVRVMRNKAVHGKLEFNGPELVEANRSLERILHHLKGLSDPPAGIAA